jgi:hypothetical protein
MNLKNLFIGTMIMCLALNGFSQKCTKFIDYQTKTINTKGLSMQLPSGLPPIGLGETSVSSLQRIASEQLQRFDLLQYNICEQLKNIKNDFIREKLQTQYSNLLMKMMELVKTSSGESAPANSADAVKTIVEAFDAGGSSQSATQPQQTAAGTENNTATAATAQTPAASAPPPASVLDEDVEVDISFPCGDFSLSSAGVIRAFGMESSMDAQVAKRIARTAALEELASKIEITVKTVAEDYTLRTKRNLTEALEQRFQSKTQTVVNRTLSGYTTACEKFTQNKSTKKFSCYIALEITEDKVLKPIYQELKQDETLKDALPSYEKFSETFNEVMNTFEKSF